jgi:hypothetical protein
MLFVLPFEWIRSIVQLFLMIILLLYPYLCEMLNLALFPNPAVRRRRVRREIFPHLIFTISVSFSA